MTKFTKLVLSGGSIKGFSQLGAIQYFSDKGQLDIDTYVGTSCGSITGYLLSIGYTPTDIITYVCTKNCMKELVDELDFTMLLNGKGLAKFNLQQIIEKMTIDKIGHLITFGELREKFNKTFICTSYNLTKRKTEYFGPDTHPQMPCVIAIRMSCGIPLIFPKYKYMNCYYIDGGVSDNLPLELVDKDNNTVLGLNLQTARDDNEDDNEDFNFMSDLTGIMFVPIHQITLNKIKNSSHLCEVFTLHTKSESKFDLTSVEILNLFSEGYKQMKMIKENIMDDLNCDDEELNRHLNCIKK